MKVAVVVDELRPNELSHARARAKRLRRAGIGVVGLRRRFSRDELASVSVVHGVGRGAWGSARRVARQCGAPIVYDHLPGTVPPRRLGHPDVVVAPGPVEAATIAPAVTRAARLVVIPPEDLCGRGGIRPRLVQRLGIGARTLAMQESADLTLGQAEGLVRALSLLVDVDLVFLGGDSWQHRGVLAKLARQDQVADRLHFAGEVPRARRLAYLAEANVGLALAEGRPRGRLDAADAFAMLGTPFVVTAVRAPDPQPSGCVSSGPSPAELANAIAAAALLGSVSAGEDDGRGFVSLIAGVGGMGAARGPARHQIASAGKIGRDERSLVTVLLDEARACQRGGDLEQAAALYGEVATAFDRPEAAAAAAVGLARLNVRAAADAAIERVMADSRRSPLAVARVAEAAAVLGDLTRARTYLKEVLAAPDPSPTTLRSAVRVHERVGEPRAALRLARQSGNEGDVARIEGALVSYDPTWLPTVSDVSGPPSPRRGRSLVLLETSLPHVRSGYTYRAQTLLRAQRQTGIEPTVLTRLGFPATRGLSAPPTERVDGVLHHRTGLPEVQSYTSVPMPAQLEANVRWAAAIAGEFGLEGIVATTPHLNGLVGLALRKVLGVPVVYDVRGFPEMTWAVRDGGADTDVFSLRRIAETRCMREADLVTTLSETMRQHIVSRGVAAERVLVLSHAVDTDAFAPAPPDLALAERLGIAGRTVVGYISSLVPYEGVETLLEAIAIARCTHPEIVGLIVGDGESLRSLETQAGTLGLDGHVVFAGRVDAGEVAPYYSLMDVFACPRRDHEVTRNVTPLKPFEAMAAGCCLAVSDLPVLREAVRDGECGALFPAGDAEALAATICRLVERPDEMKQLKRSAREHVIARHSLDTLSASFEHAWDELRRMA